ncbi:MAG: SPOR domain-containing protein [Gammaproteobacteria bacterium]|nr:SPOR domain-containing protein [Gammaproteobacteria bacterium]MBT8150257.1 SPOR domain-containing protein [Gammaproteobacteria bacterium]NND38357.1 SPOR domain-containing protein [Pseudomonadales bacterium]NNM12347.1 SPOR domain-containing protein [Pseudomonadales bacterium]
MLPRLSRILLLCSCVFCVHANTFAEENAGYSVQIGAFASPAAGLQESLSQFGTVSIDRHGGLSRFLVGQFNERGDAELLRDELRREGYDDAFVRARGKASAAATVTSQHHSHTNSGQSEADHARIHALSPEQRENVVYLDGVLHIKQGDSFIPLPE